MNQGPTKPNDQQVTLKNIAKFFAIYIGANAALFFIALIALFGAFTCMSACMLAVFLSSGIWLPLL